jgi:hypothetical protein
VTAGTGIASGFFISAAAGILGALLIPPFKDLGRFFFAFNAGLAFAFLCLAVPYRPSPLAILFGRGAAGSTGETVTAIAAGAALVLVIGYLAILYLPGGRQGKRVLALAAGAALVATAADGWGLAGLEGGAWLYSANALAAATLLGTVIIAMNLGHWYLVRARLAASHLVRFSLMMAWAVGARTVFSALGLLVAGMRSPGGLERFLGSMAVDRAVFFWPRLLFGILGPAIFAYMVYETARIRSTQSATGILYIAVIFVLMGEFLARYLMVAGAVPL